MLYNPTWTGHYGFLKLAAACASIKMLGTETLSLLTPSAPKICLRQMPASTALAYKLVDTGNVAGLITHLSYYIVLSSQKEKNKNNPLDYIYYTRSYMRKHSFHFNTITNGIFFPHMRKLRLQEVKQLDKVLTPW